MAPPAVHPPTQEQRIAALEAYVTNSDPGQSLTGVPGPGHNAWMMTSAALVLFMTLPGLALFYGGLVRRKNVLSVLGQCLGIAGLVTILWWSVGYSLVFGTSFHSQFFGGREYFFLRGVTSAPNTNYGFWVSQNVFAMYQLMFAIITPALIVGAIAERMKFTSILVFVALWMLVVYFPLAHMIWGITGFMNGVSNPNSAIKAIDFAGGTVVHMSSGWSALILCMILGPRIGFGKEKMTPHSMVLCMVGTGMLWVGWYGFNAGSAIGSDGIAANAFTTTTLATAVGAFTWGLLELTLRKHASILGFCSGAVAGLVVITPACGFVNSTGAVIIGVFAAVVPYFFVNQVKAKFGYDDALDTFGVHAIGGTIGAFLTGILAVPATLADGTVNPGAVNPNLAANVDIYINRGALWLEQLKAVGLTLCLAIGGTVILAYLVNAVIGLRAAPEVERQGLDINEHGEEGYVEI
ncbi:MAG TPA: ammonium transporter [Opitutaceae bacterium]|nr:ammonium transporter [Opitutaceae bacterium]